MLRSAWKTAWTCRRPIFAVRPLTLLALPSHIRRYSSPQQTHHRLRPYQEECVQSVLSAVADNRRKLGISLATGGGKTVIFTELIGRMHPPRPNATKTLILVHRRELVEQALRHCQARYPHARVEMELGNAHATGDADITVASVQSINSRDRIDKFDPTRFKLILVDEAHHIVADGYLKVLDHFGLLSDDETHVPALVGVSATFSRHDGLALGKAIKHIVYHKDYVDMIGEKWLSDVVFTTVKSGVDLSRVRKNAAGDFATSSLSRAVNRTTTNQVTVRSWLAKAGHRKSTLVFCVDVAHLDALTAAFRQHGLDARNVTAHTPNVQRAATIDAFRAGEFPVLLNCGVFTEGTDIPNIDCVLLARPTRSRNLLVQMIGRGMRLHPGKRDCHVIDMVASLEAGIITVPSLFGLDPDELVDAASPDAMRADKARRDAERDEKLRGEMQRLGVDDDALDVGGGSSVSDSDVTVRFTDYDSITDLLADTSGERHIRALSQNAWVSVSAGKYVLTNGSQGSHLVLERSSTTAVKSKSKSDAGVETLPESPREDDETEAPWTVKYVIPSTGIATKAPFLRPRLIATSPTLSAAVAAADTFASERFTRAFILARGAPAAWRDSPASAAQLSFLAKRVPAEERAGLGLDGLTKGEAGDMITKIRHGARGVLRALRTLRARLDKRRERDEADRTYWASEGVGVGPVEALEPPARQQKRASDARDEGGESEER